MKDLITVADKMLQAWEKYRKYRAKADKEEALKLQKMLAKLVRQEKSRQLNLL